MMHAVDKCPKGSRENLRVCVNLPSRMTSETLRGVGCYRITHHEAHFEEIGRDTHQYVDFAEEIKIQRCHPVVIRNARKEIHEDQLAIPLATIARFLVRCSFLFGTTLDNNDSWCPATCDSCVPDFSLDARAQ
jgi:hypothetical protein